MYTPISPHEACSQPLRRYNWHHSSGGHRGGRRFRSQWTHSSRRKSLSMSPLGLNSLKRWPMTGWWFQPSWKIWKSMGRIIPYIMENKNVPNHQPDGDLAAFSPIFWDYETWNLDKLGNHQQKWIYTWNIGIQHDSSIEDGDRHMKLEDQLDQVRFVAEVESQWLLWDIHGYPTVRDLFSKQDEAHEPECSHVC